MALVTHRRTAWHRLGDCRGLFGLAACLLAGGCAQLPTPGVPDALALNSAPQDAKVAPRTRSELEKATQYWGKQYAETPRDLKIALNFARNLKAMGEKQRALAVLQQASIFHGDSRELAGEYGRLALDLDQVGLAGRLLAAADDPVNPDWRLISARGTALAKQGKYSEAIPFYERALSLSHDQPSVLSNLALATAMGGDPERAETLLRRAEAADSASPKIRQNLALVLGLQGKYNEGKLLASRDLSSESAAENTAFLRQVVKLDPKEMPAGHDEGAKVAQVAEQPKSSAKPAADSGENTSKKSAKPAATAVKTADAKSVKVPEKEAPAASEAAKSLPWAADLKTPEASAPPSAASAISEAKTAPAVATAPWAPKLSAPAADPTAKTAKLNAKTADNQIEHRDVDLSLRPPTASESKPRAISEAKTAPGPDPAIEASPWATKLSASAAGPTAKDAKLNAKTADNQIEHRDVDLSLRPPTASEGKREPKTAQPSSPPDQPWTPKVALSSEPAGKR